MEEARARPGSWTPDARDQRPLWLFDDGRGRFGPLTDLTPAFDLPAGGRTLRERVQGRLARRADALWVPPPLAGLAAEEAAGIPVHPEGTGGVGDVLAVNGRWDGLDDALATRLRGLGAGRAVVTGSGAVVAAVGSAEAVAAWAAGGFCGLPGGAEPEPERVEGALVERPWDLLDRLAAGLAVDAEAREGVHVHAEATVHPTACLDGSGGPIIVAAGATVSAFVSVQGPAWIGPGAVLAPHTQLRGPASIGANAKVGGEAKCVILGPNTNKAHGGYFGDAVVGAWCNLGAGTTASNLKNTYGSVRVRLGPGDEREDTGRTFQGPLIGSFVKTAIGTRLPTGCVVGTGACLAGSAIAPSFVPPMTFTTDAGVAAMEEAPFLRTVERQLRRRGETPGPALVARLRGLLRGAS